MVSDREEVIETGDDQAVVRKKKLGNDFSSVSVFLNNYDLTVLTSTDDNAYLSYDVEKVKNKLPLTWEIKDDTLALTEEKGKCTTVHTREVAGFRKTVTHRNQVTLYLPKGTTLQECKLLLGLGDLQLTGMHTQTLDLRAMAGDVTLTDLSAENVQLCTRDGDGRRFPAQCKCGNRAGRYEIYEYYIYGGFRQYPGGRSDCGQCFIFR